MEPTVRSTPDRGPTGQADRRSAWYAWTVSIGIHAGIVGAFVVPLTPSPVPLQAFRVEIVADATSRAGQVEGQVEGQAEDQTAARSSEAVSIAGSVADESTPAQPTKALAATAPLEPAPLEPAPLEPAPLEPAPLEPAPLEPASSDEPVATPPQPLAAEEREPVAPVESHSHATGPPPPKRKPHVPDRVDPTVRPPLTLATQRHPPASPAGKQTLLKSIVEKSTASPSPKASTAQPGTTTAVQSAARTGAIGGSPTASEIGVMSGNPAPRYPPTARRRGIEGRVIVRVAVNARGTTEKAWVFRSSGFRMLDEVALSTVSKWRFTPASIAGQNVPGTVDVPVTFKLTR